MKQRLAKRTALLVLLIVATAAIAGGALMGPRNIWEKMVGSDAGDVDFTNSDFERALGTKPNVGLVGPSGYFQGALEKRVNHIVPDYQASPGKLFAIVEQAMASLPNTTPASSDPVSGRLRFIRYSPTLGFPDTVNIQIVEREGNQASFLALARARVGYSDLGKNAELLGLLIQAVNSATNQATQ